MKYRFSAEKDLSMANTKWIQIGVLGAADCSEAVASLAYEVGQEIARQHAVLLCGGLGGVMEAAAKGAHEAGGLTVGILPGPSAKTANPYIEIKVVTDMGQARNIILVRSCHAVIAVSGRYGTLSEIAVALKTGIPCIGLETWDVDPLIIRADTPREAVRKALEQANARGVG